MLVRSRNSLDDLASGIGNEDAAGGVDGLENDHGEIPPAEARDEVPDKAEWRIGQRRCARRALKLGTRVHRYEKRARVPHRCGNARATLVFRRKGAADSG